MFKFDQFIRLWNYLKGSPSEFSLESRIYNSVCVVTILVIGYNVPFSIYIGSLLTAMPFFILFCLQIYLYYLSRFKKKLVLSFVIYSVLINLFFSYNYFINGGVQGSTLLSFSISYFLIVAIAPGKQYWIWTILNLGLVLFLLVYEYDHPLSVISKYPERSGTFIDQASTYIINIILTLACLSYIRNNYSIEKRFSEENARVLKRLNDRKDKMISLISHDFSSPLTNIRNYLGILKEKDLTLEERKMLEASLHRITTDTQHLLNNLLSWTKTQFEFPDTPLTRVKVNYVLANSIGLLSELAKAKEIELDYSIDDDVEVFGHPVMFEVVVRNLIDNAIKFSSRGSQVRVKASSETGFYVLSIEDEGMGIADENVNMIFSFGTPPAYGTDNEKGAGLGLVICKEFVERQNGRIWFKSIKDTGTIFYVRFSSAR